ncbi:hypothetical protein QBC37DRAFT_387282 [Rhypophila decipiens]|uniref:Uncharacterized protein n=1 Tax=Rhypophila decipiens TaxID=261697 RepID=A0AAN6YDW7_9PEZI|nr:hypothetical protein QBC37DRAFT_387282 [Rhypophila decipiens]
MIPFTRVLTAVMGTGMINHASGWAITPPPSCPTVTETTTACPTSCRWPICAILSTLTAHCGCPDPAPTVHATFSCTPGKCLPFPPPCPTLYTVTRVTDCTGPTSSSKPPPLSSSLSSPIPSSTYPVSSSTTTSCSSTISEPPPVSSEPTSSGTSSEPPVSSSESSLPPESNTSEPPPLSESTTTSEPPMEITSSTPGPEPGTTESSTPGPSPTVPTNPPSPGPSQSGGERRLKRPLWWLGLLF